MANCTSSKCVHDCYTRCKKKITETYSKVTETEYECSGGKCNEVLENSKIPNITTNLNITIGLLNSTNCDNNNNTKSTGTSGSENNDDSHDDSKITINNIITNQPGSENSNCRCRKEFFCIYYFLYNYSINCLFYSKR